LNQEHDEGEPKDVRSMLVLSPHVWREQIPQLVSSGGNLGIANLTRNDSDFAREWIVHDLRAMQPAAHGRQFGPLEDLLLVRIASHVTLGDGVRLVSEFEPSSSQVVVGLVLGSGSAAGRWVGLIWESGETRVLDGFRLVGPGMRRVTLESPPHDTASKAEVLHGRSSRTRGALGQEVWQRVRSSRVAIIGAGRNGSAAALTLTMLGVAGIVLIDADRDEIHNLDATLESVPEGIGLFKAINRVEALRRFRPDDLEALPICRSLLDPGVSDELRGVDLVVTCVDQDAPRLAAATVANRLGKVHLDIGTGVFVNRQERHVGGDIRLFLPGEACVQCLGGLADPEQARYEVSAPAGALRRGPRQEWFEQRAGSLITINLVAVNVGIQLWLDLLAGRVTESRWCRLEWTQRGELRVQEMQRPTGACSICRRHQIPRKTE